jgi:glutathione S-transferase
MKKAGDPTPPLSSSLSSHFHFVTMTITHTLVATILLCINQAAGFASAAPHSTKESLTTPLQLFVLPSNTCPYVQRTNIALRELEIPFDMIEVTGQPKPDWFLKINPRGKVPALRVPSLSYDAVIYESGICNEFLCDYASTTLQKEYTLMPNDPLLRAKIRLCNDHCDSIYSKTQFTYLMNKDESQDEDLKKEMEDALQFYEKILAETDGSYFFGEKFSLADLHLFPFIQRMTVTLKHWKGYELPKDKFPNLINWFESCSGRESVKLSSMSEEKIIEVYSRFVEMDYKFGGLNKN